MKIVKMLLIFSCALFMYAACVNSDGHGKTYKRITKENLNIIITPDLSNRVEAKRYPKPVHDIDLIKSVFDNYYPTLYGYKNRVSRQNDVITLDFTNANIIQEYDYKGLYSFNISQKEDQNQLYLKTFDGTQTQFKTETINFLNDLENVYKQVAVRPAGADISSYFKNKLNTVVKKDKLNDTVQNYIVDTKFKNVLILFTDGYLEAGLYGSSNCTDNKCYYLDGTIVDSFRKDYKRNGKGKDLKNFFIEKGYGIIPVENDNLMAIEILVCELYDRSLNRVTGSQTIVPNDLDIIKLFWEDWLEKSGFKKHKVIPKVNSVEEFQAELMAFINE